MYIKRWRKYFPATAIFCLALLVRIIYNITVARGYIPRFDAEFYNTIAQHLVSEHCFCLFPNGPTSNRAPFWPFVISAIYFVAGPKDAYARLFLCFVGSGTCVLVYLLAKEFFGYRIAFATGVIAALYVGLFIYDGWLYSESLYTFLLLALTYALYRLQRVARPLGVIPGNLFFSLHLCWLQTVATRRWIIGSGILLALVSLTRPNGPFLLGLLIAWAVIVVLLGLLSWQTALKAVLLITVIAAGIIAPWTLRNYKVTGHYFILVATGGGNVLSGVYNDTALKDGAIWVGMDKIRPVIDFHGHNCCDYTGEADNTTYAIHWAMTHLSDMPYMLGMHFINMWKPYTDEQGLPFIEFPTRLSSRIVWNLIPPMTFLILALALLGLIVTWKRWKQQLLVVYLVILLNIGQCIIFYGSSRFRAPIEPLLVLLAGGALWWLTSDEPGTLRYRLTKKDERRAPAQDLAPAPVGP